MWYDLDEVFFQCKICKKNFQLEAKLYNNFSFLKNRIARKCKCDTWNDLITEQKDADILLEKMENNQNNFVLSRGDEVHISNEPEEILVNDDYNIIEENYTRPIRANIKKIQEFSEELVSSEYDVLKGIKKYMG